MGVVGGVVIVIIILVVVVQAGVVRIVIQVVVLAHVAINVLKICLGVLVAVEDDGVVMSSRGGEVLDRNYAVVVIVNIVVVNLVGVGIDDRRSLHSYDVAQLRCRAAKFRRCVRPRLWAGHEVQVRP